MAIDVDGIVDHLALEVGDDAQDRRSAGLVRLLRQLGDRLVERALADLRVAQVAVVVVGRR